MLISEYILRQWKGQWLNQGPQSPEYQASFDCMQEGDPLSYHMIKGAEQKDPRVLALDSLPYPSKVILYLLISLPFPMK